MTGRPFGTAALAVLLIAMVPRAADCTTSPSGKLSIEAKLDTDRVAPGEAATLTIEIRSEGLSLPDVSLSPLPGVAVDRSGTEQNFSMINGRVTRTSTTVYRIIPRTEGVVNIPPLRVTVAGDKAETSPLTLTVSRGAGARARAALRANLPPGTAPPGTPEIFVKATVDRARVFWNQQVILRLRLYSRVDVIGDVDWKPPSANGFWTEGMGPPRQGRVRMNGVEYAMMEIPTALFPTRTGALTVGPAQIRCRIARVVQPPDPWSMLAMPDVVPQDVTLGTDPVTIVVDPLPGGAPAGFEGAVGDYRLSLHVDGLTAHAGEAVAARATVTGTGNIATVRDPEIRARGASRQYVVGSSSHTDRSGDRLAGQREVDVAFVADQPGALEILPVKFVWFDPEAGRYRSQTSDSVKVAVLPGTGGGSGPGLVSTRGLAIAALRRGRGPQGSLSLDPPAGSTVLFGCSIVAFGAGVVTGRRRTRLSSDPRSVRLRALEALLARDLARAATVAAAGEPAKAAALAEDTLLAGAGLRHDAELAGLARGERGERLRSRGASEDGIAAIEALLASLDAIAYAPPETRSKDARHAIAAVRETLDRYRKEMGA